MSFVGGSISQAVALSGADARLTAVEGLAGSKVATADYEAKMALLDAKDVAHEGRLDAVEARATVLETDLAGRVQAEIDAKVATVVFDSLATELRDADSALSAALATKVAATVQSDVDALQNQAIATKVSIAQLNNLIDSFNVEIERLDGEDSAARGRLDAVEARATVLETDLAGRVQAEIDAKVATVVFDSLATELRNADSALSAALATKVAATVQSGVDAAQDAIIGLKKNAADVDAKDAEHDGKLAALIEFVRVMLKTYTITLPAGGSYAWTGAAQNISLEESGGGGGTPPPSGDYPIVINSAANNEINLTSSQAFAQNYVGFVEIVNGSPDFNALMNLNGGAVNVGTATFQSGYFQPYNIGKVIALYALPADKFPWDSMATFGVRVSANYTVV